MTMKKELRNFFGKTKVGFILVVLILPVFVPTVFLVLVAEFFVREVVVFFREGRDGLTWLVDSWKTRKTWFVYKEEEYKKIDTYDTDPGTTEDAE